MLTKREKFLAILNEKCDTEKFFSKLVKSYLKNMRYGRNPCGGESNDIHPLEAVPSKWEPIYYHNVRGKDEFYVVDNGTKLYGIAPAGSFLNRSNYPWMVCVTGEQHANKKMDPIEFQT